MKNPLDVLYLETGDCPICKKVHFFKPRFLCESCESKLENKVIHRCEECSSPLANHHHQRCVPCREDRDDGFDLKGFAAFYYDRDTRVLIHELKFKKKPNLGRCMGKYLAREAFKNGQEKWILKSDYMVPVPLYPADLKKRGYNQSEKLAQGVLDECEARGYSGVRVEARSLVKSRKTLHQRDLNREERQTNVKKAFHLENEGLFYAKNILLIDDVRTTGATLKECSKLFYECGASEVAYLAFAYRGVTARR